MTPHESPERRKGERRKHAGFVVERAEKITLQPPLRSGRDRRGAEQPNEERETCPTCGTPVRLVSGDEGTSYYVSIREQPSEDERDVRGAFYCRNCNVVGVSVDEDGLCMMCGVETMIVTLASRLTEPAPSEPISCTSSMDGCPCILPAGHEGAHHDSVAFWEDADADGPIDEPVGEQRETLGRPIICISGSSRFIGHTAILAWELEKLGCIALGMNLLPEWYDGVQADHQAEAEGVAVTLDRVHLAKIELADLLVVADVGGYVGESTRAEIAYAEGKGKPIEYIGGSGEGLELREAARRILARVEPIPATGAGE